MKTPGATVRMFCWLTFLLIVFLGCEIVRMSHTFQLLHVAWIDVVATYGVIGLAGAIALIPVSFALPKLVRIERRILFCLLVVSAANLLRLTLAAFGLRLPWVPPAFQLIGSFVLAALIFPRFQERLSQWLEETTPRVWRIDFMAFGLFTLSALFVFLEPLNPGRTAAAKPSISSAGSTRPDVVIVILDALTSRDMSLYGYHLPTTPRLEASAREWTVYTNAHSAGTGTIANLPTVLTGRYPLLDDYSRYGDLVDASEGWMSLSRVLGSVGYETICMLSAGPAAPGVYHLHKDFTLITGGGRWRGSGRDVMNSTRFNALAPKALVEEYSLASFSVWPGSVSQPTTTLDEPSYAAAQAYLRAVPPDRRPFFLYLHMTRPHDPYLANEFMGRFLPLDAGLTDAETQKRQIGNGDYAADEQPMIDRLRLRYDENILKADQQVGELVATLKQARLYDGSLIVITADHGHNFTSGHVGAFTPLLTAAEERIPLLVKLPGQATGTSQDRLVSNVDLLPTILDSIGVSYSSDWIDGESLLRPETPARIIYSRRPHVDSSTFAALSDRLKLVRRKDGVFLYDRSADPDERNNLSGRMSAGALERALESFARRMAFVRGGGGILDAPRLVTYE